MLHTKTCASPVGDLKLIASEKGLVAVLWPKLRTDKRLPFAPGDVRQVDEGEAHSVLEDAARQLGEYFAGERRRFDVPLDLRGSDFQVRSFFLLLDGGVWGFGGVFFGCLDKRSFYTRKGRDRGNPQSCAIGIA